jgi:organic hydroperoxide reductase OsmC/OhrA
MSYARNMTEHVHHFVCKTTWTGAAHGPTSSYEAYSRELLVEIDGKPPLVMSSAAVFRGDESIHNPEDLLVAALSTCHALSFLALAARARIEVVAYEDSASGTMQTKDGAIRFTDVLLRPRVTLRSADEATRARAQALHEKAHSGCFIANSVNFPVRHEATIAQ